MKPVDSHCHIYFEQFDGNREEVMDRIEDDLEFAAVPGVDTETNRKVLELCKGKDFLVPNLGIHPLYMEDSELEKVKEQVRDSKPLAIGEIGIDHYHVEDEEKRIKQEKAFREMLSLSSELGIPPVVHSREAEEKCFKMVKEQGIETAFFHCFNGSSETAEKIAREGHFIGVTTQVLDSGNVQEIAEKIELENMLLETDSPYLYPGERNEPVNVQESAEKIADLKDKDVEEVVRETTSNARSFFRRD